MRITDKFGSSLRTSLEDVYNERVKNENRKLKKQWWWSEPFPVSKSPAEVDH